MWISFWVTFRQLLPGFLCRYESRKLGGPILEQRWPWSTYKMGECLGENWTIGEGSVVSLLKLWLYSGANKEWVKMPFRPSVWTGVSPKGKSYFGRISRYGWIQRKIFIIFSNKIKCVLIWFEVLITEWTQDLKYRWIYVFSDIIGEYKVTMGP